MTGISNKAMMKLDSKNKFNGGVELEEEYGVNLYSTFYRQYDPQIGRFGGVDVLSESTMGLSGYQFGNNNPASNNDPSGAKFSPNNYGGHRPLFWGLTHSREIRDGLNMDDVEDMQFGWTSAFFSTGFGNGGGGGGPIPGTNYFTDGGDYSGYWSGVVSSVQYGTAPPPGLTQSGTSRYYEYSNGSGSGIFQTPNNNGVYTYQVGEMYHFIGAIDAVHYNVTYSGGYGNGWERAHEFLHWTEFAFTAGEVSNASRTFGEFGGEAYWVGKNMKVYSQAWGGNGFTGGRNSVRTFAKGMGKVTKPLGVITSLYSLGQAGVDVYNGHYQSAAIHTTDAIFGAIGTFGGPVGWAVSGAYFISRFWWGNEEGGIDE